MIVEQADRERNFEVSHDPFSLAGKAALLGGALYSIDKTDFSGLARFRSQRDNKFKKNLASIISNSSKNIQKKKNNFSIFRSKYASNNLVKANKDTIFAKSIDEVIQKMSGGFRGNSATFGDELRNIYNQIVHKEGVPTLSYVMREGEIAQINLRTKNANIPFNPVTKSGSVFAGKALNSNFVSRQLYHHNAAGTSYYGEDVGMARAVNRNLDAILSGQMSTSYIKHAFDSARFYNDSEDMLALNSNPVQIDLMRKSQIEDPGLKINRLQMSSETRRHFMLKKAAENRAVSGPSDISKGITHDLDSPLHSKPFLLDTPDPKKAIRDVQIKNMDGSVSYNANRNVLFADENFLKHFKDVASERGIHIGELASDQAIFNSDRMGTLIDKSRRISVAEEGMSELSEGILDKLASAAGMTPEQISEIFDEGGDLNSFSGEVQEKMRSIKLGDHRNELLAERDRIVSGYKQEMNNASLKQLGPDKLDELKRNYDSELLKINERLDQSNYLGKNIDFVRDVHVEKGMEDLFVDNISKENGQFKVGLRREELIGAGVKIHGSSGETKVVGKESVSRFQEIAEEAYTRSGNELTPELKKIIGTIDMIEPIESIKTGITDRNTSALLDSARHRAISENNTELAQVLDNYNRDYIGMNEAQRKSIFSTIEEMTGMGLDKYANQSLNGLGVVKNMEIALGKTASDMGAGGLAFVSRRHLENFSALGGDDFVEDILSRRANPEAVDAAEEFYRTMDAVKSGKKNVISINDISTDDIAEFFPNVENADINEIIERRAARLKQLGIDGDAIIDLGREVSGVSRIPLLAHSSYNGIIGAKIGASQGETRQFSELDESVRRVLYEMKSRNPEEKRLLTAIENHQNAIKMTKGTLTNNYTKDKIKQGINGIVTSAPDGLHEYSRQLSKGVENALPNFAVISDSDFRNMFGKDKFNEVADFIEKNGTYTRDTIFGEKNTFKPNAFAMLTREPVENLNHMPTAVLPASMFNSNIRDGQISVITEKRSNGWTRSFMDFLYGDTDGDMGSLVAATNEKSENFIKRLHSGNDEVATLYRQTQMDKADLQLKGHAKYGYNPDGTERGLIDVPEIERRQTQLAQKLSEKANIGILSKGLEPAHNAARSMAVNGGDLASQAKFQRIENALGFISEFTLKGKHQTQKNLMEGRSMELLEVITGSGSHSKSSVAERKASTLKILDEMILGEGNHSLAESIRQNGRTQETLEALRKAGHSEGIADISYFRSFGNTETIGDVIDAIEQGKTMGNTAEQVIQYSSEGVDSEAFKRSARRESITAITENVKNASFQGGKNFLKYALAPAAAIGFIGTLVGSKGEVRAVGQENYTDNQKRHFSSNHTPKPVIEPQMRKPKYEHVQIRGQSSQQQFNPNNLPNNSNVRFEDNQRTLNKYEIQELVERGI
ncbi:MAG: hypothetical protein PHY47_00355 [Lachnospiraceae bacterium]|nr:hypothetical protein [Lachnospiraceae bacterium]